MKKKLILALTMAMVITSLLSGNIAYGCYWVRSVDPIVSTDWLEDNGSIENLVILDVRSALDYASGHIENSISVPLDVPFSAWITMKEDLLFELPEKEELFSTLGSLGITKKSIVVCVTALNAPSEPPYSLASATRAAETLIYAGVRNVAILDGGYTKWVSEGKPVTLDIPEVTAKKYDGRIKKHKFVSIEYVEDKMGRAVIIDNRDAEVYSGEVIEPYANKAGHIPTAKSLPSISLWNPDGTYKSIAELKEMAYAVADKHDRVIVYCGVGGYASAWSFVLEQVLGYRHVRFYDGSAQEWVKYNDMVLE